MMNETIIDARAAAQRAQIEAELRRWVVRDGGRLEDICVDALFPAGKLLRPVLCLESALAAGGRYAYGLYLWHWPILVFTYVVTGWDDVGVLGGLAEPPRGSCRSRPRSSSSTWRA